MPKITPRAIPIIGLSLLIVCTFICSIVSFVEQTKLFYFSYFISFLGLYLSTKREWKISQIFIISTLLCMFFISKKPILSDDLYRYLAEGKASLNGINPFLLPPIEYPFNDYIKKSVNHSELTAIYPPLFQFIMKVIVAVHYSISSLQIFCILAFIFSIYICHKLKPNSNKLILLAWNPFFIIEGIWHAHLEIFIALFLLISVFYIEKDNKRLAYQAIGCFIYGLAIALKFIPVILLPLIFIRLNKKYYILLSFVPLATSIIFYYEDTNQLFSSLHIYLENWEFGSPIYNSLKFLGATKSTVKVILLLLYLILTSFLMYLLYNKKISFITSLALQYFTFPFFGAVVYPWYLLPALILISLSKNSYLLLYASLLIINYIHVPNYIETGKWKEPILVSVVNFILLFVILGISLKKNITLKISKKIVSKN